MITSKNSSLVKTGPVSVSFLNEIKLFVYTDKLQSFIYMTKEAEYIHILLKTYICSLKDVWHFC